MAKNYTGKRFVTKSTFYGVLDSYWSESKDREIDVYGNIWGIWDKQENDWVCSVHGWGGSIVEDPDRSVMLDLANHLNEELSEGLDPYREQAYQYQAGDEKKVKKLS